MAVAAAMLLVAAVVVVVDVVAAAAVVAVMMSSIGSVSAVALTSVSKSCLLVAYAVMAHSSC